MSESAANSTQSSLPREAPAVATEQRDVKKVPFVELFDNRLQGVVSSGSDVERVYVSYFEARTLDYCCSTNNNRPCGGLRGSPCNHLRELISEAIVQFGIERVAQFLKVPGDTVQSERDILAHAGHARSEFAADMFSRFLSDLELLELPTTSAPLPTMAWFAGQGMMNINLHMLPEGIEAFHQVIGQLDACFLNGFVGGQHQALSSLPHVFAGTPLESRIQDSVQALVRNEFLEPHFVSLAAARIALQGALHDLLRNQALAALERPAQQDDPPSAPERPPQSSALLDSTRHWLMELAIMGFARLEPNTLMSFFPTLSQLRACPAALRLSALLSGFINEILSMLPIKDAGQVPVLRWCDLWSAAMLNAVGIIEAPEPRPVTGTLYPLGVDLRQHAHMVSLIVYGVLTSDERTQFVRQTWSAFKVGAIQGDEVWLLFPKAQPLLQSLWQSKALKIHDMPILPSGDLLWNDKSVEMGKKYRPLDIASQYCGAGSSLFVPAVPPLERHPVQIAEPVAFNDCRVENRMVHLKEGLSLALDIRNAFTTEALAESTALFGLMRHDAGEWTIQPLLTGSPKGKFEFAWQAGAELLKKPPKTNTVSILKERSDRLLRR